MAVIRILIRCIWYRDDWEIRNTAPGWRGAIYSPDVALAAGRMTLPANGFPVWLWLRSYGMTTG